MKGTDQRKLRIAMVTDVFDGAWGGGMVSTERFVRELRREHEVTVVSTGSAGPGKVSVPGYYFPVPAIKRIMIKNGFIFALPKRKILEKVISECDIVHVQFPFLLGFGTIRLARKMGKPVISSFHVQPENILYNIGIKNRYLVKLMYRFLIKNVYNWSAAVVCPSPFARSELERYGLHVPGFVVSNGILPRFRPIDYPGKKADKELFVIYTVGRLSRDKRHDVIINAIKKSRYRDRIKLIIAGRGPMEEDIRRRARSLAVEARIGYVSDDELLEYYNTSDLYVHASEVELESLTVLESMACGLPPLISDSRTSAAKQFAINNDFLFRSGDDRDLAERIDHFIENRDELERARQEYLKKARNYSIEASGQRLVSLYRMVIANYLEKTETADYETDALVLH